MISGRLIGVAVPEPEAMVFVGLGLLSLLLLRTAKLRGRNATVS